MSSPESELPTAPPYWRAERFGGEVESRHAYVQIQYVILDHREVDLSLYRLLLDTGYHVAVLGTPPPSSVDRAIVEALDQGAPAALSPSLLNELWQRRHISQAFRPWLERHFTK